MGAVRTRTSFGFGISHRTLQVLASEGFKKAPAGPTVTQEDCSP